MSFYINRWSMHTYIRTYIHTSYWSISLENSAIVVLTYITRRQGSLSATWERCLPHIIINYIPYSISLLRELWSQSKNYREYSFFPFILILIPPLPSYVLLYLEKMPSAPQTGRQSSSTMILTRRAGTNYACMYWILHRHKLNLVFLIKAK